MYIYYICICIRIYIYIHIGTPFKVTYEGQSVQVCMLCPAHLP